ncbi:hypothetical protein DIPPA_56060, partial [Diplonema papillatum]
MALSRAGRASLWCTAADLPAGPGSYDVSPKQLGGRGMKSSHAPFGSSEPRELAIKQPWVTPGPTATRIRRAPRKAVCPASARRTPREHPPRQHMDTPPLKS